MNVATIGLDIAKHIFQVHGADAEEQGLNNRLGSNRRDPSDGKNVPSVPPDLAGAQSLLDFAFNRNAGQRHEAQPVGRTIQDERQAAPQLTDMLEQDDPVFGQQAADLIGQLRP